MQSAVLSVYYGSKATQSAVAPHTHPYWQMEIVTHGEIDSGCGGERFVLEAGDILLIPPGREHDFNYIRPGVAWITLKFDRPEEEAAPWGGVIRSSPVTDRFVSSFKIAIRGSASKTYEQAFVEGFLDTIFRYIRSDDFNRSGDSSAVLLGQITDKVLSKNGRAVTVNELARDLSYTRSHLSKKFKEMTGESLKTYIDKLRVQKAEELLRYREQSVSEIAADLGFSDIFAFSKFFKKHTGVSPRYSKFRR